MNTRKSILSLAISALMCMMSAPAVAANPDPVQPEFDDATGYYNISSLEELFWFAQQVNGGYTSINARLVDDIEFMDWFSLSLVDEWFWSTTYDIYFNDQERSSSIDWDPIGTSENPYTGTFDGQGHKLKNLCFAPNPLDGQTRSDFGLFGYTDGATIRCLNMENCALWSDANVGTIVATANNRTKIELCSVSEAIAHSRFEDGEGYIGGIAGQLLGSSTIKNCLVTDFQVAKTPTRTGGLAGYVTRGTTLSNCLVRQYSNLTGNAIIYGEQDPAGTTLQLCMYLSKTPHFQIIGSGIYEISENAERCGFAGLFLNNGESGDPYWGQRLGEAEYPMPKGNGVIAANERVYAAGSNILFFFNKNQNGEEDYKYVTFSDDYGITKYTGGQSPASYTQTFDVIQYYRKISNPNTRWHSIWLPFNVKASDNTDYLFFVLSEEQDLQSGAIALNPVTELPAWTPGFLYKKYNDSYIDITAENESVTNVVENNSDTLKYGDLQYIANSQPMTTLSIEEGKSALFLSGDAFWIVGENGLNLYPFRGYFTVPSSSLNVNSGAAPLRFEIKDPIDLNVVSAISTLEEEKARMEQLRYDLSGRSKQVGSRGLFINNQKKVFVR